MANPKGFRPPAAGKGRKKGSVNKSTAVVKEAVLYAYGHLTYGPRKLSGNEALAAWASDFPTEFYTRVLPRILPTEVSGADGGPITVTVKFADE